MQGEVVGDERFAEAVRDSVGDECFAEAVRDAVQPEDDVMAKKLEDLLQIIKRCEPQIINTFEPEQIIKRCARA